jgi:lysozyme
VKKPAQCKPRQPDSILVALALPSARSGLSGPRLDHDNKKRRAALSNYIIGSVGESKDGAANRDQDVSEVQGLLNIQIIKDGCTDRLLEVTGSFNHDTLNAIVEFQRRHGLSRTGWVSPNDQTFRALSQFSGPGNMHATWQAIRIIKHYEGLKLKLYDDHAGNTAIGWGHNVHRGKPGSDPISERPFVNGITEAEAEQIFRDDLWKDAEKPIRDHVRVPLSRNQFDALASLVYNLKLHVFEHSTLLKHLNKGDYLGAADHFTNFVYADHRQLAGLSSRRHEERGLFLQR